MPNRRRYHSISLKLTDEELQLWNTKHEASGLSKTDYLMQAIRNSEVRVYSIEESIAPIVHEIRKIGTNLNQLAYFSNIGQEERVRFEIGAIRRTNDEVMGQLADFLNNPKFSIKDSK
ncbi:MAG: plasmid mobilization protein [Porcipelethomonas sp.]